MLSVVRMNAERTDTYLHVFLATSNSERRLLMSAIALNASRRKLSKSVLYARRSTLFLSIKQIKQSIVQNAKTPPSLLKGQSMKKSVLFATKSLQRTFRPLNSARTNAETSLQSLFVDTVKKNLKSHLSGQSNGSIVQLDALVARVQPIGKGNRLQRFGWNNKLENPLKMKFA